MTQRIFSIVIGEDTDILLARQRTRVISALMGFDAQDQNRIATAVSEIVRNALEYARGGRVEYSIVAGTPQALEIVVIDKGDGIADVEAILAGRHVSTNGMGVGITGARRLMDDFRIESKRGEGTRVVLTKRLSKRAPPITSAMLGKIADGMPAQEPIDPIAEIRRQNHETLLQFEELQQRQKELEILNQELFDTNRGVVALYAELEERADHLRRADRLKTQFLSNVSHEFRTPLNSIQSLSRLLLERIDGPLSPEQENQVEFIRTGAEALTELVNNLLDLARADAGKVVFVPKEFSISDLFGVLRGMLRPLLVTDAVALIFDDSSALPLMNSDEGKLSQILRNIISNAIKFTERGEIRVWATHDADADIVTFHVRDTGLGIAQDDIATIWDEFSQIPNKLQASFKGTGLGLPLTRKLAFLLGAGTVTVESVLGEGSLFSVRVPRVYCAPIQSAAAFQWTPDLARLPVLALEDNAADAFSLERMLQNSNYQVISTRTIDEAREVLAQVTPVAIALDVILEGEDCWRLLIELKQSEKTHHIPVLILSRSGEEHKARSLGADEYIPKPVDASRLLKAMDSLTGSRSTMSVLLVDDDEDLRHLVRDLLPREAFLLRDVASAQEGLAAALENRPDVILLDLEMPGMDGFAFLRHAAEDSALKDIPILVVTARVISEADKARLVHAAGLHSKFDLNTPALVAAIRVAVRGNTARAA